MGGNPFPEDTIHGAFVASANADPDAIALLGDDDEGTPTLSFGQLAGLCRGLASHLDRGSRGADRCGPPVFRGDPRGIGVGASAAVSLDSSAELIVVYFAVLMAGKAFAPLETSLPPAALDGVLTALVDDANLTHHIVAAIAPDGDPPTLIPGVRTLAIRLRSGSSSGGGDDDGEPSLEVRESGVPVTYIGCDGRDGGGGWWASDRHARDGPDDVAHVIHTGGSTGRPKAVVCSHRGSLLSHAARRRAHPYEPGDVTGVCVFGVWDAACALLAGSQAAMLPPGIVRAGGDALAAAMSARRVTRTLLTPSLAKLLLAAAAESEHAPAVEALAGLRVLVLCGETSSPSLADDLLLRMNPARRQTPPGVLANLYSTSEAHDVALEPSLSLGVPTTTCGSPHDHVELAVADDDGGLIAERGKEGWLHVAGDGVAAGYLGSHGWDATRRRFVSRTWAPFATQPATTSEARTWYDTGDRAMILADGRLAVLGRGDAGAGGRVKIRGKLVDLAGVEEALEDHPLVEACACVARALSIGVQTVSGPSPDASPPASLVAFVKRRRRLRDVGTGAETEEREEGTRKERREENDEDGEEDGEEEGQLRAWLADRLPRWSVPARIVFVDGIPLTAAAASSAPKRDRRALANVPLPPAPSTRRPRRTLVGHVSDNEEAVAAAVRLAANALGVSPASDPCTWTSLMINGDSGLFSELGGASLEAQRLLFALRSAPELNPNHPESCPDPTYAWGRITPADVIAADTPARIVAAAAAAAKGTTATTTGGGALTARGLFAEAARVANELGIGMWSADGGWRDYSRRVEDATSGTTTNGASNGTGASIRGARGVLLTGATGLLGRRLMTELLARMGDDAELFCLVRGADDDVAAARLASTLSSSSSSSFSSEIPSQHRNTKPEGVLDPRVRVIAGDAAAPKLELDSSAYAQLASSVDVIVHAAGVVSAVAPYASAAFGNVAPAREMIRLALTRPGRIAVHHVSSSAALPPLGTPAAAEEKYFYRVSGDSKGVGEDGDGKGEGGTFWSERATSGGEPLAALASAGGYDTARVHGGTWQGYSQAKWVAEMLVWAAAKSGGVPVCVHRPGNIGPCAVTGEGCETDATLALAWATCAGAERTGKQSEEVDFASRSTLGGLGSTWRLWWTPADVVARAVAVVAGMTGDAWGNRALHIDPSDPPPASALLNRAWARMSSDQMRSDRTRPEPTGTVFEPTTGTVFEPTVSAPSHGTREEERDGDWDEDVELGPWREALVAGLAAFPPSLQGAARKVRSLMALKSGLSGAIGRAERRMDTAELRSMLRRSEEEGGDGFMDVSEEVLGRYVDRFARLVRDG